jgi:tight adherence protein B
MTWALAVIVISSTILIFFEIKSVRTRRLARIQAQLWPQFEELYISALQSGISLTDAFSYAEEFSSDELKRPISRLVSDLDSGVRLSIAIRTFSKQLNFSAADLFVEIVDLSHQTGGQNLIAALQDHVRAVRFELEAAGSASARTGAILNVAKLGLLAPWVLLAVLCTNEQNRQVFNTETGGLLLLGGFSLSLLAFRLVVKAGTLRELPRIFGTSAAV